MKKISMKLISLLLVSVLFLSLFSVGSFASLFLISGDAKMEGNKIVLTLSGFKSENWPFADLTVSYDARALAVEKYTEYDNAGGYVAVNTEVNPIKVAYSATSDYDEKRALADIIFNILDSSVPEFTFEISGIANQYDSIFDDEPLEIPFTQTVTVQNTNYIPPAKPDNKEEKPLTMRKMGDVDNNGTVDAADARIVLRNAVGLEELTDEARCYANMDYDGEISAADARLTLRTAVGLETVVSHSFTKNSSGAFVCEDCGKASAIKPAAHKHNIISGLCVDCGVITDNNAFEKEIALAVAPAAVGHMIDAKNTRIYQDTKPYEYKIILLEYLVLGNGKVCVSIHYNIHCRGFENSGAVYDREFYNQRGYVTYDFVTKKLSSPEIGEIMLYDNWYVRGPLSGLQYLVPSVLYFETPITGWKAMSADAAKICDEKTQTILKTEYYAYYAGI